MNLTIQYIFDANSSKQFYSASVPVRPFPSSTYRGMIREQAAIYPPSAEC